MAEESETSDDSDALAKEAVHFEAVPEEAVDE